jgi:hypothetical protein
MQVNAAEVGDEPLGEFYHVASLLIPLYAARAWEVAEHGPQAASLATAAPIADCFQIAYYCVRNSLLHPRCVALAGVNCSVAVLEAMGMSVPLLICMQSLLHTRWKWCGVMCGSRLCCWCVC